MSATPVTHQIEYPDSDGKPMAESPWHMEVMIDLILGLRSRYAKVPDSWVAGNFFLFYEEGNPKARVSPDVMLAKGIKKEKKRPNYLLWEEKPPSLIIEVTSRQTRREDQRVKKPLYEQIGVEEYIFFDPWGEYLRPRLQGYRLENGQYEPIPLQGYGSLLSRTTGLELEPEDLRLRLVDVATGKRLPWPDENAEALARLEAQAHLDAEITARLAAETRAAEEAVARLKAEERIRTLEEELSRLRKGQTG